MALEWDIRIEDENDFDVLKFGNEIKESFEHVYKNIGLEDCELEKEVLSNIEKLNFIFALR